MANNTDIVKEIEEAERVLTRNYKAHKARWYAGTSLNFNQAETIIKTLQRARDALRWKPIDDNTPYDTILLFMSHDGNVRQDFIYDEGLERAQKQYIGWMEIPAYTPEEK